MPTLESPLSLSESLGRSSVLSPRPHIDFAKSLRKANRKTTIKLGLEARGLQRAEGLGGSGGLNPENLDTFVKAFQVDEAVRSHLSALEKGPLLKGLLFVLPLVATGLSVIGGLYTVRATVSDCQDSEFKAYSRAFLYTSICCTLTTALMDKGLGLCTTLLMKHPMAAFAMYCLQALILSGFVTALTTLFVKVYKHACSSVRREVKVGFGGMFS